MDVAELLSRVQVALIPREGLWRVGRQPDPLRASRLDRGEDEPARAGNRWDSPRFGTLYFSSSLEGCFGEILARLRPKPSLAELVAEEWRGSSMRVMGPEQISRDWRDRRAAVRVESPPYACLDVEALATRQFLEDRLALPLAQLNVPSLDVSDVRGRDRRVTQLIAEHVEQLTGEVNGEVVGAFAGIRYVSRVSSEWECWAVHESLEDLRVVESRPIETSMPALRRAADRFGLTIH